ncbi:MAG TPA: hypothetical protein VF221_03475 [Chloroflexota bacterium]
MGFLVALGADAPEVTSALAAVFQGSSELGVGVVVGSNIYNLAGLLGLSAILAGRVPTTAYMLALDGGANSFLTLALVSLAVAPSLHVATGVVMLLLLAGYLTVLAVGKGRMTGLVGGENVIEATDTTPPHPEAEHHSKRRLILLALVAMLFIVGASDALVSATKTLATRFGISDIVLGTFVLAIATSLPNTWAAVSLARRGLASAAIASTFNSNSINLALGVGLPSMFVSLSTSGTTRTFELIWLAGMTVVAIALIGSRLVLTRIEGSVILSLYLAFTAISLVMLR